MTKGDDACVAQDVFRAFSHEEDRMFMKQAELFEMLCALGMEIKPEDPDDMVAHTAARIAPHCPNRRMLLL